MEKTDSKSFQHILSDALIGKRVRVYKIEYKDYEYEKYDTKPLYRYENTLNDGECLALEISEVRISPVKDRRVSLILSDNGTFARMTLTLSETIHLIV